MDPVSELKSLIEEETTNSEEFIGLGLDEANMRVRTKVFALVETFLKEKGFWEKVKNEPPGKLFVISNQGSVIQVMISDHLKKILRS